MGYSLFQSSTLGMMSQAHALDTLGTNIANVTTGGFKRTDTRFATVLSGTIRTGPGQDSAVSFANQENGLGGVRPKDFQTVDQQGLIRATERDLDVAIAGEGFFQVSPTLQVTNQILFTRDGSFEINIAGPTVPALGDDGSTINVRQGFLADKNGFFLLGVTPQADGTFANASTLTPLRVDQFAVANNFTPTTQATLNVNLPANKLFGEASENTSLTVIDSNGLARALTAEFVKTPTDNQWQLELSGDGLTNFTLGPGAAFSLATGAGPPSTGRILQLDPVTREIRVKRELFPTVGSPGAFIGLKVGDQITIAGSTNNNSTFTIGAISSDFSTITTAAATPLLGAAETITTAATLSSTRVVGNPLVFDSNGGLTSPTSFTTTLTWSDGATNTFTLDNSSMTQFAGDFTLVSFSQNGFSNSNLRKVTFDGAGHVVGQFEDGSTRRIYKVPLATFANANGLEGRDGNVYAESVTSGTPRSQFADVTGIATLQPNTVELSNVDLAGQFTAMIKVQQAYNSSATVFKTIDEMTIVARDLKA